MGSQLPLRVAQRVTEEDQDEDRVRVAGLTYLSLSTVSWVWPPRILKVFPDGVGQAFLSPRLSQQAVNEPEQRPWVLAWEQIQ